MMKATRISIVRRIVIFEATANEVDRQRYLHPSRLSSKIDSDFQQLSNCHLINVSWEASEVGVVPPPVSFVVCPLKRCGTSHGFLCLKEPSCQLPGRVHNQLLMDAHSLPYHVCRFFSYLNTRQHRRTTDPIITFCP